MRLRRGSLQDSDWPKLSHALGRLAEAPDLHRRHRQRVDHGDAGKVPAPQGQARPGTGDRRLPAADAAGVPGAGLPSLRRWGLCQLKEDTHRKCASGLFGSLPNTKLSTTVKGVGYLVHTEAHIDGCHRKQRDSRVRGFLARAQSSFSTNVKSS